MIMRVDMDGDVAVVTMNDEGAPHNTITMEFGRELQSVFERLEADENVRAIVLASGKPDSFIVGANIDMLSGFTDAHQVTGLVRDMAEALRRLERSGKPSVAAVHGSALGGGLEVALACHAIVISDDKKTVLGLPEVQLGLLPGANGLIRVARRCGLQTALDLGLTGRNVRPAKAKNIGLCDEVCPAAVLLSVAKGLARRLASGERLPPRKHKLSDQATRAMLEDTPMGRALMFKKAREATRKKTRGHYPATERIIDILETYGREGAEAAAELEAKVFGELVVSDTSHRLVEIFKAQTALKKDTGVADPKVKPREVGHVTVLGGGLMGGGISFVTVQAGIPVRIKERDDAGVGRALKHVRQLLDERVRRRAMTREERDQVFARVSATTDFSGMGRTDLVIEAVFEDLALKHAILRDVEANLPDGAIFASNTSSIPITRIAEASRRPERVIGMHYFSPVNKMPLLEIIRTKRTAPDVIATVVAFGKKQGKTVIVVDDGVGFYTSRILAPYMNEAAYLVTEGAPVDLIDEAMVDWGFPVGPLTLLDEVGIDVAAHVGPIMLGAFGDRMAPPAAMSALVADDRKGRKNGRGVYLYDEPKKPRGLAALTKLTRRKSKRVDESVYTALGVTPKPGAVPAAEIQMRCALQMVNEALYCLGEGVLKSPRDGDIGAIFGLGFPPFRGGPFRFVDAAGAKDILARVRAYQDRFGARWTPAPLLVDLAKENRKLYV